MATAIGLVPFLGNSATSPTSIQAMVSEQILTVKEAADRLESSRSTITLWCREGKFPNAKKIVTRVGEHWEIPESDVDGVEIKIGRPKKGDSI